MSKYINFVDRLYDGSYRIHGSIGYRRYFGYSKKVAIKKYIEEARAEEFLCCH